MPRYRLTIAYDGTDFCGWQKQEPPSGMDISPAKVMDGAGTGHDPSRMVLRTVQEVVERAVREVVREPVQLIGASRTDAGVHARGQVAAFTCGGEAEGETEKRSDGETEGLRDGGTGGSATGEAKGDVAEVQAHGPSPRPRGGWPVSRGMDTLVRAVNSQLPDDVLVVGADVADDHFDPIRGAMAKGYSYTLHVSPHRPLWDRRFVHHVWVPLNVERMREAAARFIGEHDFAAFAASGHGRVSTVRTVHECRVVEEGMEARRHAGTESGRWEVEAEMERGFAARRLRIEIAGNGFLWNMVRIVAGTLVEVGRGKMLPDDVSKAIESRDRRRAGPTLPPTGLCLEWVRYDDR